MPINFFFNNRVITFCISYKSVHASEVQHMNEKHNGNQKPGLLASQVIPGVKVPFMSAYVTSSFDRSLTVLKQTALHLSFVHLPYKMLC